MSWVKLSLSGITMESKTGIKTGGGSGLRLILKKIIRKLTHCIYYRAEYLILEKELGLSNKKFPDEFEPRCARDDPDFFPQIKKHFPPKHELFKKRFGEDNIDCFTVYPKKNPRLVGYICIATVKYYEPMFRYCFEFEPKRIYQFDGYLVPEYRKGMLSLFFMSYLLDNYLANGYTHTIAIVDKSLNTNLKFHAYLKFYETGKKAVIHYIFKIPFTHLESYSERHFKSRVKRKNG